jgi:hypothetical protein
MSRFAEEPMQIGLTASAGNQEARINDLQNGDDVTDDNDDEEEEEYEIEDILGHQLQKNVCASRAL